MSIDNREDLYRIANSAQFHILYFAQGINPGCRGMRIYPRNRLFYVLSNSHGDRNFVRDDKRTMTLQVNQLLFIPAYYRAELCLDDTLNYLSVHAGLRIFSGIELFSGCKEFKMIDAPQELSELLQIRQRGKENLFFHALRMRELIFSRILSIANLFPAECFDKIFRLRNYWNLTDYLSNHGNAETQVSDLAALTGETRESFSRKFTATTEITPKKLIDHFLIEQALELLSKEFSVKETAFQLKFRDEFAFSRFFKRHTGYAPSIFRQLRARL